MAYKSIGGDLEVIRNAIQDSTTSPYASSTGYGASTKYVFAFYKKPAAATPTDQELYDRADRERTLPVIVDVEIVDAAPLSMRGGKMGELPVMIRCFAKSDTTVTFKGKKMEAHMLAMEKLNEILYEFQTNLTIKAAFVAAGMYIQYDGYGSLRPIDPGNTQDFGYALNITFTRTTRT